MLLSCLNALSTIAFIIINYLTMKANKNDKNTGGKARGGWDDDDESTSNSNNQPKKSPWEKPMQNTNEVNIRISDGNPNNMRKQKNEIYEDKKTFYPPM